MTIYNYINSQNQSEVMAYENDVEWLDQPKWLNLLRYLTPVLRTFEVYSLSIF